ncbi:MAG: FliM/FliN family flagellar motor C-terminal domain-containing protein [Chthoniobacterales bacterium]|nr:FliM/FliN family flagellar motor C-terminal domain-containing protein [Chthoniobacterales bacterium]
MSESEETKSAQEQKSSSVIEGATPSLEVPESLPEAESTQVTSPEAGLPKEVSPESPSLQKVELKKHSTLAPHSSPAPAVAALAGRALIHPKKEIDSHAPQVGMEVEIDFILDRKRISLTTLSTLAEGEVLALSGADFRATLFLQEKAIAEAELVMVDQRPAVQITKIFAS